MGKIDDIHRIVGTLEERTRMLPELAKRVDRLEKQQIRQTSFLRGVKWLGSIFLGTIITGCTFIGMNPEKVSSVIKKFLILN